MKLNIFSILCSIYLLFYNLPAAFAVSDPGWPRLYSEGSKKLILYQPQIDQWKDYQQISFRCAFSLTLAADEKPIYGIVEVNSPTTVDTAARTVTILELDFSVRIPEVDKGKSSHLEKVVRSLLPHKKSIEVSLDRVIAYLDSKKTSQRSVKVNLEPPPIFFSERPAILLIFVGEPVFKPVPGVDLMFAVNTNWPVFLDQSSSTYYLLNGDSWLSSVDPEKGDWSAVKKLPASFAKLPKDSNWQDIKKQIPGKLAEVIPKVFYSSQPAELILTEGSPTFSPIRGTRLMYVSNTEAAVFLSNQEKKYYYLVAGRWFSANSLNGSWKAATYQLPSDFKKIPVDHKMSFVRASVLGTDEAEDAVLLASIPQSNTFNRDQAKLDVDYAGKPVFENIESSNLQYAVNTSYDVFKVNNAYYACFQGIWFTSSQATGPWIVADSVPKQIYNIPVSHPKHNVTYVIVTNSSPTTVTTSHTSGYSGQYVSSGLLMFGAGLAVGAIIADDDDDHYHYYYPPPPIYYSYGGGAYYHYSSGGYYRHATAYGPYGGAGRSAYYNPSTGTFARSASVVTPHGASFARQAYNPYTDTYAARAGSVTPYGASSRGYVSQGDDWAKGGQNVNASGRSAWVQTSDGSKAVGYNKHGAGGYGGVAKTESGDVYAGKNGTVYKHDNDGGWYKRQGDDWNQVQKPEYKKADYQQARSRSSFNYSNAQSQLSRDAYARSRGNSLSSRSSTFQQHYRASGHSFSGARRSGRRR